jgi:hypothetical protein
MRRCLVVANQTLMSSALLHELVARHNAQPCVFHVVVPATRIHTGIVWTEGAAIANARDTLASALRSFTDEGLTATGTIGDENPVLAVADILNQHPYDEIIISTLPPGISRWLKRDLPHRLARRFNKPVTHLGAYPTHPRIGGSGGMTTP